MLSNIFRLEFVQHAMAPKTLLRGFARMHISIEHEVEISVRDRIESFEQEPHQSQRHPPAVFNHAFLSMPSTVGLRRIQARRAGITSLAGPCHGSADSSSLGKAHAPVLELSRQFDTQYKRLAADCTQAAALDTSLI